MPGRRRSSRAASLAISFNSPACKLFEFKPLRNPMQHDLVTKPFEHMSTAGSIRRPDPGLGIEVIEEVVEGYRSEKVLAALSLAAASLKVGTSLQWEE